MQNEKTLNIREDFFEQTFVKKLRALENGGEYILIYLKLQSLSAGKKTNRRKSCKGCPAFATPLPRYGTGRWYDTG